MSEDTAVPVTSEKFDLAVFDRIGQLRDRSPRDADVLMELFKQDAVHRRRVRWAYFWLRVGSTLLGFSALVVMGVVATAFIQAGAVVPASIGLTAGAGSVVAIFVTGRPPHPPGRQSAVTKSQRSR